MRSACNGSITHTHIHTHTRTHTNTHIVQARLTAEPMGVGAGRYLGAAGHSTEADIASEGELSADHPRENPRRDLSNCRDNREGELGLSGDVPVGPRNSSNVQLMLDHKFCSKVSISAETTLLIAIVLFLRDGFFVGLMSVASSYMVFILHRHHRQVRHLHAPGRSPGAMPEVRAAKRVVALVTLYVLLYGRQTIMLSILLNMKEKSSLLMNSHMVLGFTFSAVSPFLIIQGDRRMRTFWKRDSPVSNRNPS
uniref:Vomeronasal type-1 receptor n=1 Tax=Ornithorhynchus anatinus TaxID=9258 RepID=F6YVS4_ORNAN